MKNTPMTVALDEARAAKTSAEMATALERIDAVKSEIVVQRESLTTQLQEAIVAGRDLTKLQASIAQADRDVMHREAAVAAFSLRHEDLRKHEQAAELDATKQRARETASELAKVAQRLAAAVDAARVANADYDELRSKLDRINGSLEAARVSPRDIQRAPTIARQIIGEVRRPSGSTVFGRRTDEALYDVVNDIVTGRDIQPRRRDALRWGRVGESRGAASQITASLSQRN